MMYRRAIPLVLALVVALAVALPGWSGAAANLAANRWTLTFLAVVFAFKATLFGWMRRLMTHSTAGNTRSLTIFGAALCDLFLALIVFNVALACFFGCFAWSSWRRHPLEQWQIIALRAALAGTGTLVLGTGFGVAWEIRRSRTGVAVHVPSPSDRVVSQMVDRRVGPPDRRKATP